MHYFRTYTKISVGNAHSRENERNIGYILHCFRCGYRSVVRRDEFFSQSKKDSDAQFSLDCPSCRASKLRIGGPLWIGKIQSKDFVGSCSKISKLSVFEQEITFENREEVPTEMQKDIIQFLSSVEKGKK